MAAAIHSGAETPARDRTSRRTCENVVEVRLPAKPIFRFPSCAVYETDPLLFYAFFLTANAFITPIGTVNAREEIPSLLHGTLCFFRCGFTGSASGNQQAHPTAQAF